MDGNIPQDTSCRSPVTQVDNRNVILMAHETLTKEGFMVVMKPTHVARKFYMVNFIPELGRTFGFIVLSFSQ